MTLKTITLMKFLTDFFNRFVSSKTQELPMLTSTELLIRVSLLAESEEHKAQTILQIIEVLEQEIIIKNK
jgi:hypothetical protein